MTPANPPADEFLGATIGARYRIISRLGAGGMGTAYRAWDEQAGVPVVIKIPNQAFFEDPTFAERFRREIRLLRGLVHPHVVPIVDDGEHEGMPFVVMRFLPGGSLSQRRLRDEGGRVKPNPPGMLHLWLPAVADALDAIHSSGVVHRDVKPANVFFDAGWGAFVGDFGIAKIVAESDTFDREQTLTATHMGIGTPDYMAPEQFAPKAAVDGRADQYALAVIVHEMLAGTRPFSGEAANLIVEILTQPAPRLDRTCSGLPPSLVAAVDRGLAKRPEERFATCGEFAAAVLRDVPPLDDEPGVARLLCPKCANLLKLPTSAAGRKGKCPKCQTEMKVADDLGAMWLLDEASRQEHAASIGGFELAGGRVRSDAPSLDTFRPVTVTTPSRTAPRRARRGILAWIDGHGLIVGAVLAIAAVVSWLLPAAKIDVDTLVRHEAASKLQAEKRALGQKLADTIEIETSLRKDLAESRATVARLERALNDARSRVPTPEAPPPTSPSSPAHDPSDTITRATATLEADPSNTTTDGVVGADAVRQHAADHDSQSVESPETGKDAALANEPFDGDPDSQHLASDKRHQRSPEAGPVPETKQNNQPVDDGKKVQMPNTFVWNPKDRRLPGGEHRLVMKLITPGMFQMGSNDGDEQERPVHPVRITKPFYLGIHEVTNAQWKAVMGTMPSNAPDMTRPVEQVSWDDAVKFCETLSGMAEEKKAGRVYRLPTEAEWEYACRAKTTTRYAFGDVDDKLGDFAWFKDNASDQTHPVGRKLPNAWGLHDMHGNVWEWCGDWYGRYDEKEALDPEGPANGDKRIRRGGSFGDAAARGRCRSAHRGLLPQSEKIRNLGFRLAMSPPG